MPGETEAPRRAKAMNIAHLKPVTAARKGHVYDAPVGICPEDLLQPGFWKHAVGAGLLRRHDHIEAVAVDDSWYAEFLILYIGRNAAKLLMIKPDSAGVTWMIDEGLKTETETHYVKFVPNDKTRWGVYRKSDKDNVKVGFTSKEEAVEWMEKNLRNIAA